MHASSNKTTSRRVPLGGPPRTAFKQATERQHKGNTNAAKKIAERQHKGKTSATKKEQQSNTRRQ